MTSSEKADPARPVPLLPTRNHLNLGSPDISSPLMMNDAAGLKLPAILQNAASMPPSAPGSPPPQSFGAIGPM